MVKIGLIGGSGLDDPKILDEAREIDLETPYGKPSCLIKEGKIAGVEVALLPRHGRRHTIPPSQVNFRANIYALKEIGCTHILATTACGSLKGKIKRGDLVILDQFIDFTRHRKITYHEQFEPEKAVHTPMAEPFSEVLRKLLIDACKELQLDHHKRGTVVTIEGPRFSTKAESKMFQIWGADVINMSVAPEAILANEMGIPYAAVAMSTDYDCWKEDEAPVSWDEIMKIFSQNVEKVTSLLIQVVKGMRNIMSDKIRERIRTVPHWPKQGIMFRDITTLLKDSEGFNEAIDLLVDRYRNMNIDVVAGIESRGFITGAALAHRLGVGFVPIRKPGKLPAETVSEEYELEYGTDKIEVHRDAIQEGTQVLVVDDLVATGGTALAACNLINKLGGGVVECSFLVDLIDIGGKKKLMDAGYNVFNLVTFEGD